MRNSDEYTPPRYKLLRHNYPESMRKLEEYCKKVKESGLHYGAYVAAYPESLKQRAEEKKMRICKKCGKEFEVKKQKDRLTYCRYTHCEACRGLEKKEYKLICQDCGKEMTAPTPRKKRCDECKVLYQRELTRRNHERKRQEKRVREV